MIIYLTASFPTQCTSLSLSLSFTPSLFISCFQSYFFPSIGEVFIHVCVYSGYLTMIFIFVIRLKTPTRQELRNDWLTAKTFISSPSYAEKWANTLIIKHVLITCFNKQKMMSIQAKRTPIYLPRSS